MSAAGSGGRSEPVRWGSILSSLSSSSAPPSRLRVVLVQVWESGKHQHQPACKIALLDSEQTTLHLLHSGHAEHDTPSHEGVEGRSSTQHARNDRGLVLQVQGWSASAPRDGKRCSLQAQVLMVIKAPSAK